MDVNENACLLGKRGVLGSIASRLAPAGASVLQMMGLATAEQ